MKMNLKTEQKQIFSAKMLESMEILQLNNFELINYITEISMENPIIDINTTTEDSLTQDDTLRKKLEWLDSTDEQNKIYYHSDYEENEEADKWNLLADTEDDMAKSLLEQLHMTDLTKQNMKICEFIILNLNDDGYFDDVVQDEFHLKIVQSLEPAGIAARTLSERLIIQLKRKNIQNSLTENLIQNDLEALSKQQLSTLAAKYKVTKDELLEALTIIKTLSPKLGTAFDRKEQMNYIIPDIIVIKFKDFFEIILNKNDFPEISINTTYLKMLSKSDDKELQHYLNSKLKQADFIKNCIQQRNTTLLRVANYIVEKQSKFFNLGSGNLSPLKLSDVAEALDLHESTISRSIRNKYLQCSFGVFPLKYFFVNKISSKTNTDATSQNVKTELKKIIENEDKKSPLSDQKLSDILTANGIDIKRRTIAKYREELQIPPASSRKIFT